MTRSLWGFGLKLIISLMGSRRAIRERTTEWLRSKSRRASEDDPSASVQTTFYETVR